MDPGRRSRTRFTPGFHDNPVWDATKAPAMDAFLARHGGLVFLHYFINGNREPKALVYRRLCWCARRPLAKALPNLGFVRDLMNYPDDR